MENQNYNVFRMDISGYIDKYNLRKMTLKIHTHTYTHTHTHTHIHIHIQRERKILFYY